MTQPNIPIRPWKRFSKCSSSSTPSHKLKRISSTSTYIVDDDEDTDHVKSSSFENTSILTAKDRPRDVNNRTSKRIDKTTSSTTCTSGRKFWNCNAKPVNSFMPETAVIQEESEVISALTKQLYKIESQMQKVQGNLKRSEEQLKTKDQEITRLKRKAKEWETKSKNQEILRKKEQQQRRIQTEHSEYLYKRCLMLEQRIIEMEKFLGDYGMMWVGDTNNLNIPETIPNNTIETCYEQIIANIDQLNLAAGKGEVHVQHNEKGNRATFKTHSCMSLKFYKNGMIVQDGPLRTYEDPTTMSFLRDILDGYFPSELQETYPEGVPFKVEDHRNQMFLNSVDFPGHGYRLGKHHQTENSPMTAKPRRPSTSLNKQTRGALSKDSPSNFDVSSPLTPFISRSLKQKSPIEAPPFEMYVLRSQILASHNNICSDSHLQSHINAELGLSSRKEKREMTARNSDHDTSSREGNLKSRGIMRFPSSGRCYHSSSERSAKLSPNRLENNEDRIRQRSRSASLPNSRLSINSRSAPRAKLSADFTKSDSNAMQFSSPSTQQNTPKICQRSTKSAVPVRKNAVRRTPPILHQINEPSGKSGELRLKVRSLNGGTVYLVHLSADEPIARLYQLLDRAMARTVPRGYKIVLSGYSPRRLEQLGSTLREIGITRDSVLHLVND
ncbi:UBX domain-containing protein 11 [Anthophora quadrimaculata]